MNSKRNLKIALTFDIEANSSDVERKTQERYSGINQAMPKVLDLLSKHGVPATWFIQHDYECKVDQEFPSVVERMKENGEIGCHVHFHNSSIRNKDYERGYSFQEKLIRDSTNSLRANGYQVYSFRGGANFFDENTLKIIEDLDYKIDSSVIPGLYREPEPDFIVNHKQRLSSKPYYPSYSNHCFPGDSKILEIPISIFPYMRFRNNFFVAVIGRHMFLCQSPNTLLRKIKVIFAQSTKRLGRPIPIVLTAHSYDFLDNTTNRIRNLEILITTLKQQNAEFATIDKLRRDNWTTVYPFELQNTFLTITSSTFLKYFWRIPFVERLINYL